MKIVIFGLTLSSSWGNGHATLWRGLCKALSKRGHRVIFYERDVPYYAAHRDALAVEGCELRIYPDWNSVSLAARLELEDCDLGIVTSYCPDAVLASELLLNSEAKVRVFYDLD